MECAFVGVVEEANKVCIRKSNFKPQPISRTRCWKGAFLIKSSVFFWYLRISRRATVPRHQWWGFFMPPKDLARFRAAFVARWMCGAFPPVNLRAVCFVLAIVKLSMLLFFVFYFLCVCGCCGWWMFCSLGKMGGSIMTQNSKKEKFEPSVHWYNSTYPSQ